MKSGRITIVNGDMKTVYPGSYRSEGGETTIRYREESGEVVISVAGKKAEIVRAGSIVPRLTIEENEVHEALITLNEGTIAFETRGVEVFVERQDCGLNVRIVYEMLQNGTVYDTVRFLITIKEQDR